MRGTSGQVEPCEYFNWAAHAPPLALEGAFEGDWDAVVDRAKGYLADLAGRHQRDVSLHHNTTGAFQRIATRLRLHFEDSSPVLLLTDQEYPGVVALLDEQWHGPMVMVKTAAAVWDGRPEEVQSRLLLAIQRFKPQVILLSHVARTTGLVMTDGWLTEVRERSPGSIIILDGAQAMGNVHVSESVLRTAHFYVFSGHKWLRGLATLGIVVARQDLWSVDDPGQGYSVQAGSRGTGSQTVLASLVGAFRRFPFLGTEEYALSVSDKAQELARLLMDRGLHPVGLMEGADSWLWNGIVSVRLGDHRPLGTKNRPAYSILHPEVFRSADLGWVAAGPRYLVDFGGKTGTEGGQVGDCTIESTASCCDVPVPCPPHGVGRLCVTWEHATEHLEPLADEVWQRCHGGSDQNGCPPAGGGP